MPIRVLSPQVASKIAAGEVVERPASVVKELIENAIDARATQIRIETRQGGRRLVRVTDNGCGIPEQEMSLAFARHATSKISSEDDLAHITTLGFRGEALASIASVSQVTMLSQVESEASGTLLRLEGGELVRSEKHGGRTGTVVTVENLFYNTPARLKFLRSEATESSHIIELVSAYAMAYPELSVHLIDNGRLVLQTSGNGRLYDVLVKTFGLQVAQQLLPVESGELPPTANVDHTSRDPQAHPERSEDAGLSPGKGLVNAPTASVQRSLVPDIAGYVGQPSLHRATRNYQIFFVNRRWIQDRSVSFAIEEAYRTLIPTGRHPIAVLSIRMTPAEVDVNVHPTKREVRFQEPRGVFSAVQRAVRRTIIGQAPVAAITTQPAAVLPHAGPRPELLPARQAAWNAGLDRGRMALEVQRTGDVEPPQASVPMLERLPMLRVLGQVRQAYVIAEGPDGLYLIDQHAAHERVLFEQLQAEQQAMNVSSQALLEPVSLELPPQQRSLLDSLLKHLASFGFDIAPFGGDTYLVRAIPVALNATQASAVLAELLDAAKEGADATVSAPHMLTIISCHSAVRAGQTLTLDEARELIRQLERTTSPYTCPHGRPTMIHLSSVQLERSFGRR